jgi:hypothetical protein
MQSVHAEKNQCKSYALEISECALTGMRHSLAMKLFDKDALSAAAACNAAILLFNDTLCFRQLSSYSSVI